ncbi:MAG TPA: hypothetical protein VLL75_22565 [Vicinamibacteria bacterium]|nr:hypothetical protein [Vicinamibacteria bacterium]
MSVASPPSSRRRLCLPGPRAEANLLVARSNRLPSGLAGKVQAAGGSITRTIDQVGIAVARSENPAFKGRAAAIPEIGAVVPNLVIDWLPDQKVVAADFGNPPASGDDDFYFDLQWGHDAVDAPEAWNEGHRGAGALASRCWGTQGAAPSTGSSAASCTPPITAPT